MVDAIELTPLKRENKFGDGIDDESWMKDLFYVPGKYREDRYYPRAKVRSLHLTAHAASI